MDDGFRVCFVAVSMVVLATFVAFFKTGLPCGFAVAVATPLVADAFLSGVFVTDLASTFGLAAEAGFAGALLVVLTGVLAGAFADVFTAGFAVSFLMGLAAGFDTSFVLVAGLAVVLAIVFLTGLALGFVVAFLAAGLLAALAAVFTTGLALEALLAMVLSFLAGVFIFCLLAAALLASA